MLHSAIGLDKTAVGDKREEKNAKNPGKTAAGYDIFKKSLNEVREQVARSEVIKVKYAF